MAVLVGLLAALVLLFLIVILGVMREAVILRDDVKALSELITEPPVPSFLGQPLPAMAAEQLAPAGDWSGIVRRPHIVLFFREGCFGCEDLLARVQQAIRQGVLSSVDISCVVSGTEGSPLLAMAHSISRNAVLDAQGALLKACEVRGTPSMFAIWTDTLEVFDYMIGGDAEWMRQRLQQPTHLVSTAAVHG